MQGLKGKKAEDFVYWLEQIKFLLPGEMTISEARELFERKIKYEEQKKHEKNSKLI